MEIEFKREEKYFVLKQEDIEKYLGAIHKATLLTAVQLIEVGRQADGKEPNSYVVVNEDQPYAEQVWTLIKEQWEKDNAI